MNFPDVVEAVSELMISKSSSANGHSGDEQTVSRSKTTKLRQSRCKIAAAVVQITTGIAVSLGITYGRPAIAAPQQQASTAPTIAPSQQMVAAINEPKDGGHSLDDRKVYPYTYMFPEGLPYGMTVHAHLADFPTDCCGGWDAAATLTGSSLKLSFWSASGRIGRGQDVLEADTEHPGVYVGYHTAVDLSEKNSPHWIRSPIVIGPADQQDLIMSHPWLKHSSILVGLPIN
jgi:hypothetical protein